MREAPAPLRNSERDTTQTIPPVGGMVCCLNVLRRRCYGTSAAAASTNTYPYRESRPAAPRSSAVAFMIPRTSSLILPFVLPSVTPFAMRSAATPATWGDAIDVPEPYL